MRFLKRHWLVLVFLLLLAAGGGLWWYKRTQAQEKPLKTEHPTSQNLTKTLEVSGLVDAKEKVSLRFAAGGKLTYLKYQEGDAIKKGTVVAQIDARELQKRLQQDLNAYMSERWDWEQTLDDTKDRALPKREIRDKDKSQWDLNDTVLSVEIRDIAIQNTRLVSPINGILISSPTTVAGLNLLATDVFEIVNPDTLIFKAAVDEADIANVKPGQKASITLDSYPDQPIETYVDSISYKSSQSSTGTVFVVTLPIYGEALLTRYRLGMNGDVSVTLDTRENVISIPLDATKKRDNKTYVTVVKNPGCTTDCQTEDREIEVDLETDDRVEVVSGLSTDDLIVIP